MSESLRTLVTGLVFGESPRWREGRLWVSDWGAQEIVSIDPGGRSRVDVRLHLGSFQPICLDWLPDGHLLVVSSRDAVLLRQERDGTLVKHADLSPIARGWN